MKERGWYKPYAGAVMKEWKGKMFRSDRQVIALVGKTEVAAGQYEVARCGMTNLRQRIMTWME